MQTKPLTTGRLFGTIYDFPEVGDELPRHTHTVDDVHITIVARGRLVVFGDGWEREVASGAILDWEPGIYHGFRSIEANSRLVNIVKGQLTVAPTE